MAFFTFDNKLLPPVNCINKLDSLIKALDFDFINVKVSKKEQNNDDNESNYEVDGSISIEYSDEIVKIYSLFKTMKITYENKPNKKTTINTTSILKIISFTGVSKEDSVSFIILNIITQRERNTFATNDFSEKIYEKVKTKRSMKSLRSLSKVVKVRSKSSLSQSKSVISKFSKDFNDTPFTRKSNVINTLMSEVDLDDEVLIKLGYMKKEKVMTNNLEKLQKYSSACIIRAFVYKYIVNKSASQREKYNKLYKKELFRTIIRNKTIGYNYRTFEARNNISSSSPTKLGIIQTMPDHQIISSPLLTNLSNNLSNEKPKMLRDLNRRFSVKNATSKSNKLVFPDNKCTEKVENSENSFLDQCFADKKESNKHLLDYDKPIQLTKSKSLSNIQSISKFTKEYKSKTFDKRIKSLSKTKKSIINYGAITNKSLRKDMKVIFNNIDKSEKKSKKRKSIEYSQNITHQKKIVKKNDKEKRLKDYKLKVNDIVKISQSIVSINCQIKERLNLNSKTDKKVSYNKSHAQMINKRNSNNSFESNASSKYDDISERLKKSSTKILIKEKEVKQIKIENNILRKYKQNYEIKKLPENKDEAIDSQLVSPLTNKAIRLSDKKKTDKTKNKNDYENIKTEIQEMMNNVRLKRDAVIDLKNKTIRGSNKPTVNIKKKLRFDENNNSVIEKAIKKSKEKKKQAKISKICITDTPIFNKTHYLVQYAEDETRNKKEKDTRRNSKTKNSNKSNKCLIPNDNLIAIANNISSIETKEKKRNRVKITFANKTIKDIERKKKEYQQAIQDKQNSERKKSKKTITQQNESKIEKSLYEYVNIEKFSSNLFRNYNKMSSNEDNMIENEVSFSVNSNDNFIDKLRLNSKITKINCDLCDSHEDAHLCIENYKHNNIIFYHKVNKIDDNLVQTSISCCNCIIIKVNLTNKTLLFSENLASKQIYCSSCKERLHLMKFEFMNLVNDVNNSDNDSESDKIIPSFFMFHHMGLNNKLKLPVSNENNTETNQLIDMTFKLFTHILLKEKSLIGVPYYSSQEVVSNNNINSMLVKKFDYIIKCPVCKQNEEANLSVNFENLTVKHILISNNKIKANHTLDLEFIGYSMPKAKFNSDYIILQRKFMYNHSEYFRIIHNLSNTNVNENDIKLSSIILEKQKSYSYFLNYHTNGLIVPERPTIFTKDLLTRYSSKNPMTNSLLEKEKSFSAPKGIIREKSSKVLKKKIGLMLEPSFSTRCNNSLYIFNINQLKQNKGFFSLIPEKRNKPESTKSNTTLKKLYKSGIKEKSSSKTKVSNQNEIIYDCIICNSKFKITDFQIERSESDLSLRYKFKPNHPKILHKSDQLALCPLLHYELVAKIETIKTYNDWFDDSLFSSSNKFLVEFAKVNNTFECVRCFKNVIEVVLMFKFHIKIDNIHQNEGNQTKCSVCNQQVQYFIYKVRHHVNKGDLELS